jgi:hypothetical protein
VVINVGLESFAIITETIQRLDFAKNVKAASRAEKRRAGERAKERQQMRKLASKKGKA